MANLVLLSAGACASLERLGAFVQAPRFEQAEDYSNEVRLLPARGGLPAGATIRLWRTVTNPNPFGLTLSSVDARLLLDDVPAADADFPLGLPLEPGQSETIPLDVTVSFANVPKLANVLRQAASGAAVDYRLEGSVGIDAGRLGQPTFGPMTIVSGDLRARF